MPYKATKRQAEYQREYRQKHRVHIRELHRKWMAAHKDINQANGAQWRGKLKLETLSHYGNGKMACTVCNETHPSCLTIDHINGGGNQHRRELNGIDGIAFYSWLRKGGFPEGYQTLCMNCQFKKAYGNKENGRTIK